MLNATECNTIAHYYIPNILHLQSNCESMFTRICVWSDDAETEHTHRMCTCTPYPQGRTAWLSDLGSSLINDTNNKVSSTLFWVLKHRHMLKAFSCCVWQTSLLCRVYSWSRCSGSSTEVVTLTVRMRWLIWWPVNLVGWMRRTKWVKGQPAHTLITHPKPDCPL